jgi:glycosyltransferase involved in cell wall biosynthesis
VPALDTPLRVRVVIDSLTWGGAEALLADLAAGAPSAGIELSVDYLADRDGSPAARALRELGIEPQLVPATGMLDLRAALALKRHLAQSRPELVHTHLHYADVLGLSAARMLRLPAVSTVHLIAGAPTGHDVSAGLRGAAKARLPALARRHVAARVLAVSDAAREAYLGARLDVAAHVSTVHNGIARSADRAAGERVRAELGIERDALVLSTVTVLRRGKGHEVLFEAAAELLARFPKMRLLVLGDGPERERIEALARPFGGVAIMPGHRSDVMAVLAASDVLVHPTTVDAFPTAMLEAAAAAVPVVATRVGGIPEIVQDGRTGLLVDPPPRARQLVSALATLLENAELRAAIGERAQERFRNHFTAELWARRLRLVYDEVLADGHARSGERALERGEGSLPGASEVGDSG